MVRSDHLLAGGPAVDAVVLVGGLGTRLRSVISDRPKPLAPVMGRPFLDLLLHQLATSGVVRSVVLAVGYRSNVIREAYSEGRRFGLPIALAEEEVPLGTAGAAANALPNVESADLLLLNGDSYIEADLGAHLARHRSSRAHATLMLTPTSFPDRFGTVEVDDHDRVISFREKTAGGPRPALINAGVYVFRRETLDRLPRHRALSLETDVLPGLAASRQLAASTCHGRFIDIGLPETYEAAQSYLADLAASVEQAGDL
jgi:NDP-sugar pyrophosphorylase family protein